MSKRSEKEIMMVKMEYENKYIGNSKKNFCFIYLNVKNYK